MPSLTVAVTAKECMTGPSQTRLPSRFLAASFSPSPSRDLPSHPFKSPPVKASPPPLPTPLPFPLSSLATLSQNSANTAAHIGSTGGFQATSPARDRGNRCGLRWPVGPPRQGPRPDFSPMRSAQVPEALPGPSHCWQCDPLRCWRPSRVHRCLLWAHRQPGPASPDGW